MNTRTILAIAIGLTVALATTAAVGAAAPDGTPAADGTGPGSIGPDGGLPGPVPDFVGDIHETIDSFLDGSIENLGESLRDLRPSDAGAP